MTDLISREDAIETVRKDIEFEKEHAIPYEDYDSGYIGGLKKAMRTIEALPSAEAEPTVIRSKTLMPTKDFKEWAKRIKEENPNAIVIPCDAEVVSADAEPKWTCTANFVAEQLERLKDMTDEERLKLLQTMFPSADTVSREFYEDAVKANIRIVIENRELKEQIESADQRSKS